jgi:hypothetical protein
LTAFQGEAVSGSKPVSETACSRQPANHTLIGQLAMSFSLVFETDSLPLYVGEYQTIDEAYGAAQGMVAYFRSKGYPTLNQYCIRQTV